MTGVHDSNGNRLSLYRAAGKRALDLSVVLALIPFVMPLAAAIALAIRLTMGAPVLFRQPRPGLGGETFSLLKFRTMTEAREETGNLLPDQQRITRLGAFLRRSSLDELPQLLNVIRGDMSLVGPRPLLLEYLALYSDGEKLRHAVKPGITGWAQVHGRNAISWDARFRYDVEYVRRCSLHFDLAILCRTIWVVVKRQGIASPGHATMPRFKRGGSDQGGDVQ